MAVERFLDTNIFIRYFTKDDPVKAARCFELIQRLKRGEERATTSESVLAEVVYVLSSKRHYGLPRDVIRKHLGPVIELRGLRLSSKTLYLRALELYVAHEIDFEDALTATHVELQGLKAVLSYDRGFDEIVGDAREEP